MNNPDEISVEELQQALSETKRNKLIQRFPAATAHKDGITQTELVK